MVHPPMAATRAGPPSYNLETGQGDYVCSPHGYGAIPTQPCIPPPPNFAVFAFINPMVDNIHSRVVTCYPVNSVAVGMLEEGFTCLGIFWPVIPPSFGFMCCFASRERRCPSCVFNLRGEKYCFK
uniref:Brain protein I3 n=1 Tax=Oryctolagus cuniculus TaxID=9986 RepID=A0A5F9DNP3_RABIT